MHRVGALFLLALTSWGAAACKAGTVLEEMNFARTRPREYADVVDARMRTIPGADMRCVAEAEAFLRRQQPLAALESVPGLAASAREQVDGQGTAGEIGHRGVDGGNPWSRMAKEGQCVGRAGENISYGYADARSIVVTLIVDQGVANRGHRKNIFCRDFKVAGAACGAHARWGAMCVIDFAGGFSNKKNVASTDGWGTDEFR